jgi:hypothetical protein
LKTFGAYLEISAGYALTATGLGAILGVPLILHGADTAISGLRSLADGENHRTFTSEYLLQKGLGLSKGGSEAVDTAIGFLGGVAKGLMKAGQWGLKPLAKWASKQPYVEDFLPYKAVGHTSWGGKITIIPNLGFSHRWAQAFLQQPGRG